jgi:hypothetical protein
MCLCRSVSVDVSLSMCLCRSVSVGLPLWVCVFEPVFVCLSLRAILGVALLRNPSRQLLQPTYSGRVYEFSFSGGDNVTSHRIAVTNPLFIDANCMPKRSCSLPPMKERGIGAYRSTRECCCELAAVHRQIIEVAALLTEPRKSGGYPRPEKGDGDDLGFVGAECRSQPTVSSNQRLSAPEGLSALHSPGCPREAPLFRVGPACVYPGVVHGLR